MKPWIEKVMVPLVVALIAAAGAVGAVLVDKNKPSPEATPSINPTRTTPNVTAGSECNKAVATKVCIASVTVQVNSDEPKLVTHDERISLKAGDHLRLVNLRYCVSPQATANRVDGRAYLFKNAVESYNEGLLTRSSFPTNTGCHSIGNFEKSWKVESGQHRTVIPIIQYDGSNKIVYKNFYFNLDVGA